MIELSYKEHEIARWMMEQYCSSLNTDRPDAFTYIRAVDSGEVGILAHSETHVFKTVHQDRITALRDADYINQHVSLIFLNVELMESVFPRSECST